MTTVTVRYVNAPIGKANHSIKTADDKYYGYKAGAFSFKVGKSYEIETKAREWQNKTYHDVTAAKLVGTGNGHVAPSSSADRWYMPFVSNTVAHAIAAGHIKDPMDIKLWAAAARQAAIELDDDAPDIPV